MKVIVTHTSPDWDAITSVWVLKRFLPGWENAHVDFVSAGNRLEHSKATDDALENVGGKEVIHVDTGLGPLDHHQTQDQNVCGASRTWAYVKAQIAKSQNGDTQKENAKHVAVDRIVDVVVDVDHFQEVFWGDPAADYQEFSLLGVLEGIKFQYPDSDDMYVTLGMQMLDALLHDFENRIWAEHEIENNEKKFQTRYGEGVAFESTNDTVMKLAQKMGFVLVVRKDPRKGYVRIKVRPQKRIKNYDLGVMNNEKGEGIDLTLAYEQLKKMDPDATWFLHVSKKMLLNGTPKNPKMIPSTLTLDQIVSVLEGIYK